MKKENGYILLFLLFDSFRGEETWSVGCLIEVVALATLRRFFLFFSLLFSILYFHFHYTIFTKYVDFFML